MSELGSLLRRLRKDAPLGLRECARLAGISAAYLTDLETGKRLPAKEHTIRRLAWVISTDPLPLLRAAQYDRIMHALPDDIPEPARCTAAELCLADLSAEQLARILKIIAEVPR